MKIIKRLIKEEAGSTIVFFAILMTVLVGMVGAVTDYGMLYYNRYKLSNAVDAAALAGGQDLPNMSNAETTAEEYLSKNGFDPTNAVITVNDTKNQITVQDNQDVELYFARIFGYKTINVNAEAVVKAGAVKSVIGAAPLAIQKQSNGENFGFNYGQEYVLKTNDSTYGWFGPLSLGASGASTYRDNIENGFKQKLTVNDVVNTETGNVSGPTKEALNFLIGLSGSDTFDNFTKDCPRVIKIPVIETVTGSGQQVSQVKVVGFAAFYVKSVGGVGNDSIVDGYFVKQTSNGDVDFSQTDYGLTGVKLIQ